MATLAAGPALAQPTIQFTKPADADLANKANAFLPSNDARKGSVGDFNAPSGVFGGNRSAGAYDVLPGSPGRNLVSPEESRQWQKMLDEKKNWALSTPAEIMGVTTPEKILGLADPKHEDNLSAAERYLRRLDRAEMAAATNHYSLRPEGFLRGDTKSDPFGRNEEDTPFGRPKTALAAREAGTGSFFNPLADATPNSPDGSGREPDSKWANPFGLPAPLPKPSLEQVAEMERFRAMLETAAPVEKTPVFNQPSLTARPFGSAPPAPLFNPVGHSFTPLQSGIGKPTGVKPLPSITEPNLTPTTTKSTTRAQLPPWLSDAPPNGPLQRQF